MRGQVQVVNKVPLTAAVLKESIDLVRGAVKICYPMGLPHYDPVYEELMGAYIGTNAGRKASDSPLSSILWAPMFHVGLVDETPQSGRL